MGYSYGVIGSPQERADWAICTVDAGVASARRFFGGGLAQVERLQRLQQQ
ncbi:hypothetical protein J2W28_005954 [Variovorax boronicumulans]|nr:hypothetical protein [Variovorax boronicumulans]MDP9995754.1 hypothetical protein [Variovorax boronicumulans]MDQ0006781.1 hypothetical protein [Variovorax boronicumulans]